MFGGGAVGLLDLYISYSFSTMTRSREDDIKRELLAIRMLCERIILFFYCSNFQDNSNLI